jgi:hypothetical protein
MHGSQPGVPVFYIRVYSLWDVLCLTLPLRLVQHVDLPGSHTTVGIALSFLEAHGPPCLALRVLS